MADSTERKKLEELLYFRIEWLREDIRKEAGYVAAAVFFVLEELYYKPLSVEGAYGDLPVLMPTTLRDLHIISSRSLFLSL